MTVVYLPTGDAINGDAFGVTFRFPRSQSNWIYSVFVGMLEVMLQSSTWYEAGETTVDEAIAAFQAILWSAELMVIGVGDIKFTATPPVSGVWLLCDGSLYTGIAYPDLYAAIGTLFNTGGEPSGDFRVPDMRGRVPVMTNNGSGRLPSWADAPGGNGGESEHTLTTSEMPSHSHTNVPHSHSIPSFLLTGTAVPPPLDAGTELPLSLSSSGASGVSIDSAGGDQPHNNIQPTMALACYILAAF